MTAEPSTAARHRMGRPPLTERRKAATRLEIARAAVELFAAQGIAATSAEEIAAAAGISVRTLWRYFPTKESCVLPLLTPGIELIAQAMGEWDAASGIAGLTDLVERHGHENRTNTPTLLTLVRLTRTEPGLRAVWLQAHADAEPVFVAELARRARVSESDLSVHVRAAMLNCALRVAIEHYAAHSTPDTDDEAALLTTVRAALRAIDQPLS